MEKSSHLHKELASNIRKLLGEGKLDAALEQFEDTFLKNEASGLLGRLRELEVETHGGTLREEEKLVQRNRIRKAALSLVRRLEKGPVQGRPVWIKALAGVLGLGLLGLLGWWVLGRAEERRVVCS